MTAIPYEIKNTFINLIPGTTAIGHALIIEKQINSSNYNNNNNNTNITTYTKSNNNEEKKRSITSNTK